MPEATDGEEASGDDPLANLLATGIKAWAICPGFVDTDMGYVVPGVNPATFLRVGEVVEVVRHLLQAGDNVKLGPEILIRTTRSPMEA
jgi:hypothetical protein